jgi:DNA-binding MarR family transcriptional regulator
MALRDVRLAIEAWESLLRAQATISRDLTAALADTDVQPREYGVLYALSGAPTGLRMSELNDDALLTQTGMSRLIARLEGRGLVEREDDPEDKRACRIRLTAAGSTAQRVAGAAHARHVTEVMSRNLDAAALRTLRDLSRDLIAPSDPAALFGRSNSSARDAEETSTE